MRIPTWIDPHRKRKGIISYSDKDFTPYYDFDKNDFRDLVIKLKSGQHLTEEENDRYGMHIITICMIVQENARFKQKPRIEKEEMIEQQYYELLTNIQCFNPEKGEIYAYAYRIAYTAACHYYTNKINDKKKKDAIEQHCIEELEEYMNEFSDHKTPRH